MQCSVIVRDGGDPEMRCELEFRHEGPHKMGRFTVIIIEEPA